MDVDPVLHVKDLMLKKERIENEIKEYHAILQSVKYHFSSMFTVLRNAKY